eukprot:6201856-Amphidinium_carterae.1
MPKLSRAHLACLERDIAGMQRGKQACTEQEVWQRAEFLLKLVTPIGAVIKANFTYGTYH